MVASVLCFGFLDVRHVRSSWPGIKSILPALEGKVLTIGPPGKSPLSHLDYKLHGLNNCSCHELQLASVMLMSQCWLWERKPKKKKMFSTKWSMYLWIMSTEASLRHFHLKRCCRLVHSSCNRGRESPLAHYSFAEDRDLVPSVVLTNQNF